MSYRYDVHVSYLLLVANWSTYKRVRYGAAVWWLPPLLLSYSIWLEIDAFITAWHKHFEDLSDRINMEIIMRGWAAVGGKVIVNLLHMCPYWMTVLFQLPRGYKVCDKTDNEKAFLNRPYSILSTKRQRRIITCIRHSSSMLNGVQVFRVLECHDVNTQAL